ncbi:MAG: DUF3520 domain-containing protein [Verrucomicrobia bacterium]|jgi:Ca-activated chloride channel homolog|nr:DUF3520 domain-containing protein [Verrucomicrobiota bacterium]
MNCEQIHPLLTQYLLAELDPKTADSIKAHLETCPVCQAELALLEPTLALLSDALAEPATAQKRLESTRRKRVLHPSRLGRTFHWVGTSHPRMAMAAGVMFVAGFLWFLVTPAAMHSAKKARASRVRFGLDLEMPPPQRGVTVTVVEPEPMEALEDIEEPLAESPAPKLLPDPLMPPHPIEVDFTPAATLPALEVAAPSQDVSVQPAEFDSVAMVKSPVVMKGIYAGRTPAGRAEALRRFGGSGGGSTGGDGDDLGIVVADVSRERPSELINLAFADSDADSLPDGWETADRSGASVPAKETVPILGDTPIAGRLFRKTTKTSGTPGSLRFKALPKPDDNNRDQPTDWFLGDAAEVADSETVESRSELNGTVVPSSGSTETRAASSQERRRSFYYSLVSESKPTGGKVASPPRPRPATRGVAATAKPADTLATLEANVSAAVDDLVEHNRLHSISRVEARGSMKGRYAEALGERRNQLTTELMLLEASHPALQGAKAEVIREVGQLTQATGEVSADPELKEKSESEELLACQDQPVELAKLKREEKSLAGNLQPDHLELRDVRSKISGIEKKLSVAAEVEMQKLKGRHKALTIQLDAIETAEYKWQVKRQLAEAREAEHKRLDQRLKTAEEKLELAQETEEKRLQEERESEAREDPARFKAFGVNPFVAVADQAFSTFAIDVDTAAYTLGRNYLKQGYLPPAESVRTEEYVNFFDYAYKAPARDTFTVYTDVAPSTFGRGQHLLKIGVKGRRLGREEQRQASLTFLIDTSGSMNQTDRLGLVQKSLGLLVNEMNADDRVAIVQYGSHARLVLEHTPISDKEAILKAINSLQCGGSTNLEEGMHRAYALAAANFVPKGENRVLLLSDGVANLGSGAAEDILEKVDAFRRQGITCSVFGFGMGTYDDVMLETLANKGDGAYAFIDSESEARRVFIDDLSATLNTIAADVKIQVEYNPAFVARYRQLGYENRQLRKEDFRNDAVDAGEVGSGQSVTALYELELASAMKAPRRHSGVATDVIATVRVRYRRIDTGAVEEIEHRVRQQNVLPRFADASPRFKLAAGVAEFSEILRGSPFAKGSTPEDVANMIRPAALELTLDHHVQEFLRLVQGASGMSRGR